jgi:hypothetical protein
MWFSTILICKNKYVCRGLSLFKVKTLYINCELPARQHTAIQLKNEYRELPVGNIQQFNSKKEYRELPARQHTAIQLKERVS